MSQEKEPSIIEYARFYGLIRDHLEDDPLQQLAALRDNSLDLEDDGDLFQSPADTAHASNERLTLDKGAASLLSSVLALAQQPPSRCDVDDEIDTHRVRRMKLEVPLLRSDPEVDLLRFAPPIVPDLEHEFLPLETVDEEADEGLAWPTRCYDLPDEYERRSKAEKLLVTSDALVFLHEALNFHTEGGPHENFEDVDLPYTKKNKVQPVSPPLLPMSPEPLPFIPLSDTGRIELLSDHTSPTGEEARQAERIIFADDAILPTMKEAEASSQNSDPMLLDPESLGDNYSPLKGITEPPSSPPILVRSLHDRKVEVPLSPPTTEPPPPWKRKSVSFREALTEVIHDLPPPIPDPENVPLDDIDVFFEERVRPISIKAERRIEQEQLQEVDTTLRVTVPVMDFSLPTAPWKADLRDPGSATHEIAKAIMLEVKAVHLSKHVWPLSGKVERELRWTPFPAALGKVEIQEDISDDNLVAQYIAQPDRVDVSTLTWKPDGLRILDELAEPDEELDEGAFPEERDIDSLIRKRKYELQADDSSPAPAKAGSRSKLKGRRQSKDEVEAVTNTFSALDALDSYMNIRKGDAEEPKLTAPKRSPEASQARTRADLPKPTVFMGALPANQPNVSIPSPAFTTPTSPIPFVVSASFLGDRKLARRIQRLYPSAEFIERDFSLHLEFKERPTSKAKAALLHQSSMADEADMILSPGVGLMWTTLQKVKQRSLPGQVARPAIKERIKRASPRYERLLVLINGGRSTFESNAIEGSELDSNDCEALVEFTNFCSALESEVQITFIAGGEDNLAKWVVAMMVKHGITDPGLKLIQDETLWEVFLRRAGMNAFAAQAILANLKAPDQAEPEISEEYGLAAFVRMAMKERFARFETLMGGRQLLARVSRVLDAKW